MGTPQTTVAQLRFAKYMSGTRFGVEPEVTFLREGGDGQDFGYSFKNRQKSSGQLVFNARPEILGQLLQLLPGGATWDGGSAPALHTFHSGHASYPWSTIVTQHPGSDIGHLLSDVRFTGITFEYESGQPVKITAPFIALSHGASIGAFTASYDTREEPFLYHHSPTFVLDSSGDTAISRVMIEHTFNVEELQAQSVELDDAVVQNKDTTIEITRRYEDATLWKKVAMGAGVSPTISVPTSSLRVNQQYFSGGSIRQLDMNAKLIAWETADIGELNPDGVTVNDVYAGKILKGATHAIFAQLKNLHASAY